MRVFICFASAPVAERSVQAVTAMTKKKAVSYRGWLVAAALALFATTSRAQPTDEYQIKAVFLFHFAQFVEWPAKAFPDPKSPLVIGVLGRDPFGAYLDQVVAGET